jgi:hypothetical protein
VNPAQKNVYVSVISDPMEALGIEVTYVKYSKHGLPSACKEGSPTRPISEQKTIFEQASPALSKTEQDT